MVTLYRHKLEILFSIVFFFFFTIFEKRLEKHDKHTSSQTRPAMGREPGSSRAEQPQGRGTGGSAPDGPRWALRLWAAGSSAGRPGLHTSVLIQGLAGAGSALVTHIHPKPRRGPAAPLRLPHQDSPRPGPGHPFACTRLFSFPS